MNRIAASILCQLHAIREFVECDNLCADDYIELHNAAREALTSLDRAIARANEREIAFRQCGSLPPDGSAA